MTVRKVTDSQKSLIAWQYKHHIYTVRELAIHFQVSDRTIYRILEEQGVHPSHHKQPIEQETFLKRSLQILKNAIARKFLS